MLLALEMQADPNSGRTADAGRTGLAGSPRGPWLPAPKVLSKPQQDTDRTPAEGSRLQDKDSSAGQLSS